MNFFNKSKLSFLILIIFSYPYFISAQINDSVCSSIGYTVLTINGINTTKDGAIDNKRNLEDHLLPTYKNQPLTVDFLYNPTHSLAGDVVDSFNQKFDDQSQADLQDYDFAQMLRDASAKLTTQKVLFVGHSQGNFYANSLYDDVIDEPWGIPSQSMGVYSVATPADRVAGGGLYLTSDTDNVIDKLPNILKPNVHINFSPSDDGGLGHDFSKIYLTYQGDRIVSDIDISLSKLKNNNMQSEDAPCLTPPNSTVAQKVQGTLLAVLDPASNTIQTVVVDTSVSLYQAGNTISQAYLAMINNSGKFFADIFSGSGNYVASVITTTTDPAQIAQNPTLGTINANPNPTTIESVSQSSSADSNSSDSPSPTIVNIATLASPNVPSLSGQNNSTPSIRFSASATQINLAASTATNNSATDSTESLTDTSSGSDSSQASGTQDDQSGSSTSDIGAGGGQNSSGDSTGGNQDSTTLPANTNPDTTPSDSGSTTPPAPALVTTTIDTDTTLPAGEYTYDNLIITNNATLTLSGDTSRDSFKGVKINAKNITIDSGSSISADYQGYGNLSGPGGASLSGPGPSYSGANYGSPSYGNVNTNTYGSATQPTDLGSGGVSHGGGAIRIVVSNTFTDNGIVSANGNASSSGGSVYLTTQSITGSGIIRADGGILFQSGFFMSAGGGGRVAVYYQNSSFAGTVEAKGGCGSYDSYTKVCAADGTVGIFDQSKNDLYLSGSAWQFLKVDAPFALNNIFISNGASVASDAGLNISAKSLTLDSASKFTLADNQVLNIPDIKVGGNSTLTLSGTETISADNFTVTGNSTVTVLPLKILSLNISNITIDSGSSISADGKGYGLGAGPGAPTSTFDPNNLGPYYAGASYGGVGSGNTQTSTYGSETAPVDFGSGGNGGHAGGGGAIRLIVSNSLINNGTVSVSGNETSSGGSIYVTVNSLSGSGAFQANGGNPFCPSTCYSGGAGGRVAVYYQSSSFTGTNLANGWRGYQGYGGISGNGTVDMIDQSSEPVLSSD